MAHRFTLGGMGLDAVGAYIRRLRERANLTQAQLVDQLGGAVSLRTIGRWENGRHEPYMSELAPVINYLHGSMPRVLLLMLSETAQTRDGEQMADRADQELTDEELAFFVGLSPARRKLFRQFIEGESGD